jgi:2-keto-3-deoxy-6-phosphogluconate aldolase
MVRAQRLGALYVPEIALRGTRADIDRALKLISAMRTKYPDAIIAAGSVSDPDSSQRAVAAGVNIVITPGFLLGKADIDYNRSRGCETCLGIGSLKEALEAKAAGLKYAKAFPLRIKAKPEDDIEIIQRALIDVFKGPLVDDLRPYLSKVRISRAEGAEEATYANIRRFVEGKPTEDKVFMLVPWGVELVETLQGVFTDAAVTATGGATDEDIATMRLERGLNMAKSVKNLDEAKRTAAMLLEESRVRGLLAQASREAGPTASGGEAVNVDIIRQRMAKDNGPGARPITEIIDTYFADPRNGYGPGVLTPSPAEIASFYPAISMLENERVEVYLPKDISDSLTRSVTEEIRRMNIVIRERIRKHTGRKDVADPIEIIPYDSVNIEACLKRNGDGVRRIFVNDTTMTAEFRRLTESESGLDILRGRRIVTMSLPKGRDETEKTVNQAWLIKVSLLSALLDESNILTVGASLKDEISGRISDNPVRFVENLAKAEGDAASRDAIRARVNYFMNTIVKLSTFIGEQLRILKAFWIAA